MIKVEFWDDPKTGKCSDKAQLLFVGMWNFADDSGIVRGDPTYLKSKIFPYKENYLKNLEESIKELKDQQLILEIKYNNEKYFWIKNFSKHQAISHPSNFRYIESLNDDYGELLNDSSSPPVVPIEDSHPKVKEKVKEKDIYIVLDHWNSKKKLQTHELKGEIGRKIKQQIGKHLSNGDSVESIKQAIENYYEILIGKEYYFKYKWDLDEFLQRRGGYLRFKKPLKELQDNFTDKKKEPEYEHPQADQEWLK